MATCRIHSVSSVASRSVVVITITRRRRLSLRPPRLPSPPPPRYAIVATGNRAVIERTSAPLRGRQSLYHLCDGPTSNHQYLPRLCPQYYRLAVMSPTVERPGYVLKYSIFWLTVYPLMAGRPRRMNVVFDRHTFLQRDHPGAAPLLIPVITRSPTTDAENRKSARRAAARAIVNTAKYVRLSIKPKDDNDQEVELEITIQRQMTLGIIMKDLFHLMFRDVNANDLRFTFNGRSISDTDTPVSLGMDNVIEKIIVE